MIRRWAILLSSILGGIYACICCLSPQSWLSHPLVRISFSGLLCLIAFRKEMHLIRCTVIFVCISLTAGGLLSAVTMSYNGIRYIPLHFKTAFLAFCTLYFIFSLFFRNISVPKEREFQNIRVALNGQSITFRALHDSGNELQDPITNRPVLICRAELLRPLFPAIPHWHKDVYEQFSAISSLEDYQGRMRLIPCQTITGHGMLLGFQPDSVLIGGKAAPHIVAFSPIDFPAEASYQAIY